MSDVSFILVYVERRRRQRSVLRVDSGRGAIESSPTFAMLPAAPGLMLGLWKRDGVKPPAAEASGEIAITAANDAEVDRLLAEWRAQGVAIAQAPAAMDFGYNFLALDPDGRRLRVFAPGAN